VLERDNDEIVSVAATDPDLAGRRDDPRFQAMIASAEVRLAGATTGGERTLAHRYPRVNRPKKSSGGKRPSMANAARA
jgi:hypothetical protein